MNHVYRVVWRAALGTWVAVSETARGQGKSSRSAKAARPVAGALGLLAAAGALAQSVAVTPGGQTSAYVSANGVTVVNIAGANAAGLSHNRYQQFNIDPKGLVLNNTTAAQAQYASQLAGQVVANYNMSASAKVILNEVMTNNRSLLAGFAEVVGGRADVVLANPYGITCGGCGFINTDRVTLTTGVPNINPDGSLKGFSVNQGDILIQGNGLNGTAQQILDLVTRSVKIDGQVNTQDLGLYTGTNNWDYATRSVTGPASASGAAPAYAIDSSSLGGMYANRIRLVATEAGVGVRMLGDAAANGDDFTLTSAGRIEINSKLSAERDLRMASTQAGAGALALGGASLSAKRNLGLDASAGGLQLRGGTLVAGGNMEVVAGSLLDAAAAADAAGQNTRSAGADLSLRVAQQADIGALSWQSSGALTGEFGSLATGTGSQLAAGSSMQLRSTGGDVSLGAGKVQAQGSVDVQSAQALTNAGVLAANGNVTLAAGGNLSNVAGGSVQSGDVLTLQAQGRLRNEANAALAGRQIDATAAGGFANAGTVGALGNDLVIRASGSFTNTGTAYAKGTIDAADQAGGASADLVNSGTMLAEGGLKVRASQLDNQQGGWIQAATGSEVQAAGIGNDGTWLLAQADGAKSSVQVQGSLRNAGAIQGSGAVSIGADAVDNTGKLLAGGDMDVNSTQALANGAQGVIQAGGALALDTGAALTNAKGGTVSGATVDVRAAQGLTNAGTVSATAGSTTIRSGAAIDNQGTLHAKGDLDVADLNGGGTIAVGNGGRLLSEQQMRLAASTLANAQGALIQAAAGSTVTAGSVSNAGTWTLATQAGSTSQLHAGSLLDNDAAGRIQTAGSMQLDVAQLVNDGKLLAGQDLQATVTAASGLQNAGVIAADGKLGVIAGSTDATNTGTIAGNTLDMLVASLTNAGTVQGGDSQANRIQAQGTVTNQAGGVITLGTTGAGGGTLSAQDVVNDGTLQSGGNLKVAMGSGVLDNRALVQANGNLDLAARAANSIRVTNSGQLRSAGALGMVGTAGDGSQLAITGKGSVEGGSANIKVDQVAIDDGATLLSNGDLTLETKTLNLQGAGAGVLGATGGTGLAKVTINGNLDNKGLIFSGDHLQLSANAISNSNTAGIAAINGATLTATSGNIYNNGALYAGGTLAIQASQGEFTNDGTRQAEGGTVNSDSSITIDAKKVTNRSVIASANVRGNGDITITADQVDNIVAGGDDRQWRDTGYSHVEDDYQKWDGHNGYRERWNYVDTWTRQQYYASGSAPAFTPQMVADGILKITFKNQLNNIGGTLSADTISLTGTGAGATMTNDNLALNQEVVRSYYNYYIHWQALVGASKKYNDTGWRPGWCSEGSDCGNNNDNHMSEADAINAGKVGGVKTVLSSPTTGVFARVLGGSGFALVNNGSTAALADAKAGNKKDAESDPTGSGKQATGNDAIGVAPLAPRDPGAVYAAPSPAGPLAGRSFIAENVANGISGTSFGGIQIALPTNPNGYYVIAKEPGSRYLVETNPRYLVGSSSVGSDYLAMLLGYNPDQLGLRLGDDSYEAYLVRQQLIKQTGAAVLASYASADSQMKEMMEHAAGQSTSLGLEYGKALTPAQQAGLKQDIVWMVQTEIDGKTVLTPVVYLAQSTKDKLATGAVISAQDANLSLTSLTNTGGTIIGSNSLVVASAGDITNLSGLIKGGDVSLTSTEGSIVNKTVSQGGGNDQFYVTDIGRTAGIESTGNLSLDAKKDITNLGANMTAGGDASLKAGNNITFDTIENKTTGTTTEKVKNGGTITTTSTTNQVKSGLTVGGNLDAKAGNDITLAGTDAKVGGNASLDAGNNLNIVARENTSTTHTETKTSGFGQNNSLYSSTTTTTDSNSVRNVGSTLEVGGNAAMKAGQDITFQGSAADVKGSGDLQAGNNINVLAGRNYDETTTTTKTSSVLQVSAGSGKSKEASASAQASSGRGLASASAGASGSAGGQGSAGLAFSSTSTTTSNSTDLVHVGSTLNFGKDLNVNAGQDVNLQGSTINAAGNASVNATNVNLLAAEDKHTTSTSTTTTRVGLMASTDNKAGGSADASASAQGGKGTPGANAQANASGQVSSENKVDLFQREEKTASTLDTKNQGSAINAGGNLNVTATDTLTLQGSSMSSGGNMDLNAKDMKFLAAEDKHESKNSSNTTTAGLYADAKAQGSANAGAEVGLGAQAGASASGSAGVEVGLYGSNTKSSSVEGSTTAVTSSLKSGGDISRTANNNITDVGTQIEGAGNLNQSAKTIDSFAAANTTYSSSESTTHTAKIGAYAEGGVSANAQVQYGGPNASKPKSESGGGAGIRASYEYDNSKNSSSSSTAVTSGIRMGGSVNSTSSGKTTMEGTQIQAGKDVNLSASSLDYQAAKNTSSSTSSDKSANASVGVDLVKKEVAVGVGYDGNKSSESSSTAVVGGISAGGNLNVNTTGDTRFEGTQLAAGGAASVDAGGNVKFDAAKNTASAHSEGVGVDVQASGGKSGGAGSAAVNVTKSNYSLDQDVAGSITSGSGPLSIKSGGDASFTGTQIASTAGDVSVAAGGNIDMKAARTVEHSDSLGVGVSASGSGGKDSKGGVKNATTGKKTGETTVDQRAGAASIGVGSSKSDSNTASVGSITSGGGSITLSSGGNTKLEGTQVSAANGIGVSTGGTFEMKEAVSTKSSSTVGVSASASGSSQTPRAKPTNQTVTGGQAAAALPSTGGLAGGGAKQSSSPAPAPAPATSPAPAPKPSPAPAPAGTSGSSKAPAVSPPPTPGSASKPPAAPPPLNPALQQTLNQANQGTGAGSNTTGAANNAQNAALTQKGGSGVASVYVDNQSSTTTQAATLNGGSGGITIQQGVKAAPISATVALPPPAPNLPKPTATTQDGKPLPAWLKFDASTGKFQGTPPADFKGEVKVQVKVPQADGSVKTVPMSFGSTAK